MASTADLARLILANATLLAVDIDPALRALRDSAAGYPASTPGASTTAGSQHAGALDQRILDDLDADELGHLSTTRTTTVEAASGRTDRARADLERMNTAIREANRHLRIAADIAHRHATVRVNDTGVQTRLATIEAIWCTNCAHHGFRNPRREGGTVCDYCATFKSQYSQYKTYPPKAVLEIWTTRGKVWPTDVQRIMRELKTAAKQTKREERDPDWRSKADPARKLSVNPASIDDRRTRRLSA